MLKTRIFIVGFQEPGITDNGSISVTGNMAPNTGEGERADVTLNVTVTPTSIRLEHPEGKPFAIGEEAEFDLGDFLAAVIREKDPQIGVAYYDYSDEEIAEDAYIRHDERKRVWEYPITSEVYRMAAEAKPVIEMEEDEL